MNRETAEALALDALAWILADDDLRCAFVGNAGLAEDDIRNGAQDPVFLGSVLDFLCMDDAMIVGFCDAKALAYTDPMQARQALPGGEQVHWT